jgi:hypothetical protein
MLSAGVAIDSIDSPKTGNTALHWAANFGSDDVVRYLYMALFSTLLLLLGHYAKVVQMSNIPMYMEILRCTMLYVEIMT